jgi:hypothetical protein
MAKDKESNARKHYGVSLKKELMLDIQHLALDRDCYVNELLEEAMQDLLKKYASGKKKPAG